MSKTGTAEVLVIRKALWRRLSGFWIGGIGLVVELGVIWLVWSVGALAWDIGTLFLCFFPCLMLFLMGSSIYTLFWDERLELSRDGLLVRTQERSRRVRWSDIKQFRIERPADSIYPLVGWDNHDDAGDGNPRWDNDRRAGMQKQTLDADIGWGWDLSAETLCDTLEHWRHRHT